MGLAAQPRKPRLPPQKSPSKKPPPRLKQGVPGADLYRCFQWRVMKKTVSCKTLRWSWRRTFLWPTQFKAAAAISSRQQLQLDTLLRQIRPEPNNQKVSQRL